MFADVTQVGWIFQLALRQLRLTRTSSSASVEVLMCARLVGSLLAAIAGALGD